MTVHLTKLSSNYIPFQMIIQSPSELESLFTPSVIFKVYESVITALSIYFVFLFKSAFNIRYSLFITRYSLFIICERDAMWSLVMLLHNGMQLPAYLLIEGLVLLSIQSEHLLPSVL
uniref:Uncharacterized protein n=1 Tax=Glossina pallidipes TaxID=7398 RepID=A0A1B0AF72_GLOPL